MNNQTEQIGRFQLWGEWAPELLPPMRELLAKYEPLLPAWCQIAYVKYGAGESGSLAGCIVTFRYRKCNIDVGELFFHENAEERAETLLHEIIHANLNAYRNTAFNLIKDAIGDNELAWSFAERQMTESIECVTTDMTALVSGLMKLASSKNKVDNWRELD